MKNLTIGTANGKAFNLPNDKGKAATEAFAFLGRRGSGKTYAATKLAELFFEAGNQFVAIDPVGVWYGLRLGSNGKSQGLDVKIFGGLHGDIPLLPTAGALIADVVVDRAISVVIDLSQFETDTDKAKFATDFGARFFTRKSQHPSPVHVFIEEAQEIIPQNIQRGEERMLHVWQRMIRLGRNHGIGVTMISQRPQDVNKKALNQAECIFAFQLTGPQERKAVAGWISEKGLDENLANTLPSLKQGHAHVWSPVWLDVNEEVKIGAKTTFAGGATPTLDSKPIEVKPLAADDLDKLVASMGKAQDQIKANDPKELKRKIAELEKQLSAKPAVKAAPAAIDQKQIDRAVAARDKFWQGEVATPAMNLGTAITSKLRRLIERRVLQRPPDVAIGGWERPYLLRWYAIPRSRLFNVYVHQLLRSDDDRAHHDHPWWWISVVLLGSYVEETIEPGGVRRQRRYYTGSIRIHGARYAHRLILPSDSQPPTTLFITGPKIREWGFHCPRGWRHWREFTDPATDGATIGRGCE